MTAGPGSLANGSFSHDLLLHDEDADLVAEARTFVERGLASGGQVIVHGPAERVALLREALGASPRLEYGLSRDVLRSPFATLFAAQRMLAEARDPIDLWTIGVVARSQDEALPCGPGARFESLMNAILGGLPFHALCAYDTRDLPAPVLAAARATHPHLNARGLRTANPDYQQPEGFLAGPLASAPAPPQVEPSVRASLLGLRDLRWARDLLAGHAAHSALPPPTTSDFVTAVNEVLVNALVHGAPPVRLTVWAEAGKLTCLVEDVGPGIPDTLAGCRYPEPAGALGLWVARQLCEDVIIRNLPDGGCSLLLTAAGDLA